MGDPKKQRKKFKGPDHMWQKARLEEEKPLMKEHSLKSKYEIWKMGTLARSVTAQAKKLIASETKQSDKEKELLINKLVKLGLLNPNSVVDDALSITLKNVLERRLQTIVFRKGFARSTKQARQFIVHGHIKVNNKVVTSPSYLVSKTEEAQVIFAERSPFADANHPERAIQQQVQPKAKEEVKAK